MNYQVKKFPLIVQGKESGRKMAKIFSGQNFSGAPFPFQEPQQLAFSLTSIVLN